MKRQVHVVDIDELVSESVYLKIMFANIWLMIDYIFWKLYRRIAYVFMLLINFFVSFFPLWNKKNQSTFIIELVLTFQLSFIRLLPAI